MAIDLKTADSLPRAPEEIIIDGQLYHLTLEDNFDGDTINPNIQRECPEYQRQNLGGYWKNGMAEVRDGNLYLWADVNENGIPVSGAIRSKDIFTQAFGFFEARCMLPSKPKGFWGEFWMMCGEVGHVDDSSVDGIEIEIMESYMASKGWVNQTLNWDGWGAHNKFNQNILRDTSLFEGQHTYAVRWTDKFYEFYVDSKPVWCTEGGGICDKPGYMKLTTEFGTGCLPLLPEELPDCFRVDWVRVYR